MAEYIYNPVQSVEAGQNVILSGSIPCNRGCILHRDGSGIVTLRGMGTGCFARYQVTFCGNIAVPSDGAAGAISVALALDGEAIQTSKAIVTPGAVSSYFNVTSTAIIMVPRGCCYTVAVQNTSSAAIDVQSANLTVARIA